MSKFDVDVFRDKTETEALFVADKKPPRAMPDAALGVVYDGLVYPVYVDPETSRRRIYLDDDPLGKGQCPCVNSEKGLTIRIVPRGPATGPSVWRYPDDWYIESNAYGHYVVLKTSDTASVSRLVSELRSAGFDVLRWDPSYRPANNGIQYDWFIRISLSYDRDHIETFVRQALARFTGSEADNFARALEAIRKIWEVFADKDKPPAASSSAAPVDHLEAAKQHVVAALSAPEPSPAATALLAELSELQALLTDWWTPGSAADILDDDYISTLRDFIESSQSEFQETIEGLKTQVARYAAELASGAARSTALESEVRELREQIDAEVRSLSSDTGESEIDDLLAQVEAREQAVCARESAVAAKERSVTADTEQSAGAATRDPGIDTNVDGDTVYGRRPPTARERRNKRAVVQIADFLDVCFPSLAFDPDVPEVIAERFDQPSRLLGVLAGLERGEDVPMQGLEGGNHARQWSEVTRHLSTGRDDRGRVYVRKGTCANCRWDVYVHWKENDKEQIRVIQHLASLGEFVERAPFDR